MHRHRVSDEHRRVEHDSLWHERERRGGSLSRVSYVSVGVASKWLRRQRDQAWSLQVREWWIVS
jgi:hypothetical protein